MAMNLGDLLAMIRQDYLDTLEAAAADARASGVAVAIEPPLTVGEPKLNTMLWGDLRVGERLQTVASEGVFAFDETIQFGWGDALPGQPEPLQVRVKPFAWDAMEITLKLDGAGSLDVAPLQQWLAQWGTALEPDAQAEDSPFQEVVHALHQPTPTSLRADMGSAPLDAWQDLLEALLAAGAAQATFGTS